ncbi:hypothetical protein [Paenibacillus sp. IHBB 10380]|uniref:hypothetical protein n=1 Tax=Paenibacillus sp. IHBB 10380 TaxID=1566358 RepID=UPI0005CF9AA3|nr:hypothetical protein [Paenibacillus sp. IHBB 10380]AJS58413.1 hypothetical protein UB51_07770 [Paenibacillus sp. IHBB 10380]
MTTFDNNVDLTSKKLLQFCYTCEDAHACDSEEKCKSCWEEHGMLTEQEANVTETQKFLQMMHA